MAQKRPNIILFMCDQLRYDALGCYGNNQIHTPNIDRIALNGSTFDNHFVQNPVCSPSRCTVLTGRYPKNHGTRDNGIPLRDSEITFPEVLRENGYLTAAIGKMHITTQFVPKEDEQDDWPEDCYGFDIIHTLSLIHICMLTIGFIGTVFSAGLGKLESKMVKGGKKG